ncbi:anthranilate/para-aminobenzoate synthase component I [Curtobacterium sp. PhB130]|uniref:anthranilate synthase component I family protein n=1 Tax=Curtobacterium sp. PhB130 TaxID=2485178 RepID=UPI000F4C3EDE|nr:anthranilate synthase component I family protein [Curtobacterium sp. PhB130]ROS74747.1 anthranilate/para-aminobenzoate synthase component I [Curtobacterium sp. PhB130]
MDDPGGLTPRIESRRLDGIDLRRLARAQRDEFVWLDSAVPHGAPSAAHARARWSILTPCDGPFAARFRHEDRRAVLDVSMPARAWFGASRAADEPAFTVLAELLAATPALDGPIEGLGFALGWVGFLGYELGRESGGPDRTADGHADADVRFVDRAVVVRDDGASWALALVVDTEPDASSANRAWLDSVATLAAATDVRDVSPSLPSGVEATGRVTRAAHESAVDACRAEIRDGNAFQVCLTTAFALPGTGREARVGPGADPQLDEYLRMRATDPVPFGAYLRLGPLRVASRSPERFLRIDADGSVLAEPIKGTRRRLADAAADAAVRDELAASVKDRAENVMIVDLLRNDLLRTAVPGSVHVDRLCDVETYASVHQMVSTIGASLPPGVSRADVVRAAFPPGSMTGAPKISAMAIADRLEGAPRGVYSGVIGYFSASGAVDLSVVIRTLVTVVGPDADADADAGAGAGAVVRSRTLGAGGAVTWSSVPADEATEVETKTRSVLGSLGAVARW